MGTVNLAHGTNEKNKVVKAESYKEHRMVLESNIKKGKLEYPMCISST
jgi:hypothetical protein